MQSHFGQYFQAHFFAERRLQINPNITLEEAEKRLRSSVDPGGFSHPKDCTARWRVALIIPYRNRTSQVGTHVHTHFEELNELLSLNKPF